MSTGRGTAEIVFLFEPALLLYSRSYPPWPNCHTSTQTPTHMLRLISPVVASPALLEGCSSARILAQAQQ